MKKKVFRNTALFVSVSALLLAVNLFLSSCDQVNSVLTQVAAMDTTHTEQPLSSSEIISGLKNALNVGTQNAVGIVSKVDGFYKNPRIKIPFPPEAEKVKEKVIALGMQDQVNKFVSTMNHGAEQAAKKAVPIFINAIKNMTITDGLNILKGNDSAATHYLRVKTTAQLVKAFEPDVKTALQQVQVTKYWNPIINTYNKIPFVQKMNPNLDDYVTKRAVNGVFTMLKDQEKKIRKDPAARVTDILKRVFGYFERHPDQK